MKLRQAFTLIELIVVITVLGLVAASLALSYRAPFAAASFNNSVATVLRADAKQRLGTQAGSRPANLIIMPGGQRDTIRTMVDQFSTGLPSRTKMGVTIAECGTATSKSMLDEFTVPFTRNGKSPTYYIKLADEQNQVWILFAGGTGQATKFETEEELRNVLSTLRLEGIDAD